LKTLYMYKRKNCLERIISDNPCQAWNPAVRGAVFDAESDPSKITEILVVVAASQPFLVIRKTPGAKKKHPITGCASAQALRLRKPP
jgi:hypothetical protein